MPVTRTPIGFALLLIAAAPPAPAQQKAALTRPDATFDEPFTSITSLHEVAPGKVLVSDVQDKIVQLVDLSRGTALKVGREGQGPGEYGMPAGLFGLPNGQTLLQDLMNRRFLAIGADGKPGAILDYPRPPATPEREPGPPGMVIGGLGGVTSVRNVDAQGRLYFQGLPFRGLNQPALDSVPILRWDRVKPTFDTLGYVKVASGSASARGGAGRVEVRIGGGKVFAPADGWDVTPDGRLARVTPDPFRVLWTTGGGKWTPGPTLAYKPIPVTEKDKEAERERRRRARPMMIVQGGPGPGGRAPAAPPNPQDQELEFEPVKPPFESGFGLGGRTVYAAPDGEIWVLRTRPAGDNTPSYDVFDRTGALVKRVTLNPRSRVVGFGKGTVYVARSDEDDLLYLERYRKP